MGCRVAENQPLKLLRHNLGIAESCHAKVHACLQGITAHQEKDGTFAEPGAAIGYCQGLFTYDAKKSPAEHTSAVIRSLNLAGAPWAKSHELLYAHYDPNTIAEQVKDAMKPLVGDGRMTRRVV